MASALANLGEVVVFAPERDRSGASNSLTLSRPLTVRKAPNGFHFVDGTPTDCVHVAVTGLLDGPVADNGEGTDFHATAQGKVSISPLQIDLTSTAQLEKTRQWLA